MQSIAPLAGIFGAVLSSFSVVKWILIGFIVILIGWGIMSQKKSKNSLDSRAIRDLVKSASQWKTRSIQDSNPLIALMNANYAMAYFNVARAVGSDVDVETYTSISIDEFNKDLENIQAAAIQKITGMCPSTAIKSVTNTGWSNK